MNPEQKTETPSTHISGIAITAKAVKEIRRIMIADLEAQGAILRVQVVGGGCSGMSYKLGFDKEGSKPSDKMFEKDGVQVF